MTCDDAISSKQTDSAYEAFLNKFTFLYDKVSKKMCGYRKIENTQKLGDKN